MNKYRILQKCDKFYIQEYTQTGIIFKKYEWKNLGYYTNYVYKSFFHIKYYDSLDEAKAKINEFMAFDTRQEQWKTSEPKVVYETK